MKTFDLKKADRAFIVMNMTTFCPSMTRYMSALILADDNVPVPAIAEIFKVRRATVRAWLVKYRKNGLNAFFPGM